MEILYDDKYMTVIVKEPGTDSERISAADLYGPDTNARLFTVHRLDMGTGGLLVLAKDSFSARELSASFSGRRVDKEYLAAVCGVPSPGSGVMEDLLFHDRRTNKTYIADSSRKGVKAASLEYRLMCSAAAGDSTVSLVKVGLHTGRTHQIRVQFASRKLPLCGDGRYGSAVKAPWPALWCCRLSLVHPVTDEEMTFTSLPPADAFPWNVFPSLDI